MSPSRIHDLGMWEGSLRFQPYGLSGNRPRKVFSLISFFDYDMPSIPRDCTASPKLETY